jgi:hypothetical protein
MRPSESLEQLEEKVTVSPVRGVAGVCVKQALGFLLLPPATAVAEPIRLATTASERTIEKRLIESIPPPEPTESIHPA